MVSSRKSARIKAKLAPRRIRSILRDIGGHLKAMEKPEGDYNYEYNPFTGVFSSGSSTVRQIGAMISLAELHETLAERGKAASYLTRLQKTAGYWISRSATFKAGGLTLRYFPEPKKSEGKLGSNALFIIGVSYLKKRAPAFWKKYEREILEVENLIIWAQKKNGSFAKMVGTSISSFKKEKIAASDYFDGEAAYALLHIYTRGDRRKEARLAFEKAFAYFTKHYSRKYSSGFYLWCMAAMHTAYMLWSDERYLKFAEQQQALLEKKVTLKAQPFFYTMTSFLEGLGSFLLLQKTAGNERPAQSSFFNYCIERLAHLQISKNKPLKIQMGDAHFTLKPSAIGWGGFPMSLVETAQRIDVQQHTISAFKRYIELLA